METIAGLLLLYRRTVTLGLFMGTGIFLNVMMINLCYDVPVKIFSAHLLLYCLFLLAHESRRVIDFFVFNKSTAPSTSYSIRFQKKWMRIGWVAAKAIFIYFNLVLTVYNTQQRYQKEVKYVKLKGPNGHFTVKTYVENKDTIPVIPTDSIRWKDMIVDDGFGSIQTNDTLFWRRYGRGCFYYSLDSIGNFMNVKKTRGDSSLICRMRYEMPDSNTLRFWTRIRKDSVYVELVRSNHHYQLTDRPFHWISEANR